MAEIVQYLFPGACICPYIHMICWHTGCPGNGGVGGRGEGGLADLLYPLTYIRMCMLYIRKERRAVLWANWQVFRQIKNNEDTK